MIIRNMVKNILGVMLKNGIYSVTAFGNAIFGITVYGVM